MPTASDAPPTPPTPSTPPDLAAVSAFLRALATWAERDPAFGRQLGDVLRASGLLAAASAKAGYDAPGQSPARRRMRAAATRTAPATAFDAADAAPPPDLFGVLRDGGVSALQAYLATLDVPTLRQLIRQHRLDPARISARWNNRERLSVLIVEQVRARADHGKAFASI